MKLEKSFDSLVNTIVEMINSVKHDGYQNAFHEDEIFKTKKLIDLVYRQFATDHGLEPQFVVRGMHLGMRSWVHDYLVCSDQLTPECRQELSIGHDGIVRILTPNVCDEIWVEMQKSLMNHGIKVEIESCAERIIQNEKTHLFFFGPGTEDFYDIH